MRIVFAVGILGFGLTIGFVDRMHAASPAAGQAGAQAAARLSVDDHEARMKSIASTNAALRQKFMKNELPEAAKDAQELATLFGDVERFWAQHSKPEAVKWAQEGRQAATEAAGAASAGDAAKAQAAATNMLASCKQCHATMREGDAQTGYRLKAGVITQ